MKRKCINCEQFDDGYRNCGENGSEYEHCGACRLGVRDLDYYNNNDIDHCSCTISKKEFDLREELNSVVEANYFTGFHISGLESDLKYYKEQNEQLRKENEELRDTLERLDGEVTHLQMAVEKLQRNQKQENIRNLKFQIFKLQANNTMLAIEKLEELLKYIINSKWTKTVNVKHSPMQIIVNKINSMINELNREINNERRLFCRSRKQIL